MNKDMEMICNHEWRRFSIAFLVIGMVMMTPRARLAEASDVYVNEPAKEVPVVYDVDVVVAGGGIAGTIASITAARYGAKTVVIDRFGRFGGNMGPGMFAGGSLHFALQDDNALVNRKGLGGIADEFLRRVIFSRLNADQITMEQREQLAQTHWNLPGLRVGGGGLGYAVESQTVSYVAFQMMKEAGVEMLLSAYVCDPIMEGNRVRGVFVETKSGRLAVKAKIVIDATGEGDLAYRSGAPVQIRTSPNAGLTYGIKDVDWNKFYKYLNAHGVKRQKWYDSDSLPPEVG